MTINEFIFLVFQNKALLAAILAWFVAQTIKALVLSFKDKKFRFNFYSLPGGFPSSHSATSIALAVSVGLIDGFHSISFAIAAVLSFYIIYDARVTRGAAGKQAQSLNRLIEILNNDTEDSEDMEKVKEVIGHSLFEIFAGGLIGIAISFLIVYGI